MKKVLKAAAWTAAALLIAAVAGTLALKFYFTQERLQSLMKDYAARNLKREVTFDAVSISLSGLDINNLKVSEFPDFRKGEFFTAASFSVRPDLRRLLRGELQINSVSASGLSMRVAEMRPEVYNFSDLLPAETPAKPKKAREAPKAAPPRRLSVSSLKIRGSRFVYTDTEGALEVTLRDIDLDASDISPEGLFPVEASFTLAVRSPQFKGELPASLGGRIALGGFEPAKGRAEIDKAKLSLGKVRAKLSGSLKNLLEPDAKLKLAVEQFSTADLRSVFPGLPPKILLPEIDADADLKLTAGEVRLRSVKIKAGPLNASVKGTAAWKPRAVYNLSADLKAQVPEIDTTLLARKAKKYPVPRGLKLPLAEVSASLRLRPGRADAPSFTVKSAPFSASGKLFLNYSGSRPKASGRLKLDIRNLARMASIAPAALKEYSPSGSAGLDAEFSYSGKPSVKGRADLRGAGVSVAGRRLEGLSGTLALTADSASSRKLTGRLDGSPFTASFRARDLRAGPKADFDLQLEKLALPETLPAGKAAGNAVSGKGERSPAKKADVSGKVRIGELTHANLRCAGVSASFALTGVSPDLRSLGGKAEFTAGPGKFSGLYGLAGSNKAAKVALYPLLVLQKASKSKLVKGLRLPDFDSLDFDLMEGDYSFSKGVMRLRKSSLKAPAADISSSGSVDLPAEKLDMRIATKLKAASGLKMSEPVDLTVKGTFDDPSVKLDIRSITSQPAVRKAVEKLAPKAENLIKSLFK